MKKTNIEWTQTTWNPITGCTQISAGCLNCYAKRMANRLYAMGNKRYADNFKVTIHKDLFDLPLKTKKPTIIFVCSMSDLFHESNDFYTIAQIFHTMTRAHWHTFQVLTKRPERLREFSMHYEIPNNVWVGTSVEGNDYAYRVNSLRKVKAKNKFLSCEPLLGPVNNVSFNGISWVIVGGETGPHYRFLKEEWVVDARDRCKKLNIPFFFKQWAGINGKKAGCLLNGKEYKEMPEGLK